MLESTKEILLKLWKDQDIQVMVLISLTVQFFLLFTGNLRRRRISGLLRFTIWMAYVGADAVAVFSIGLLSRYEEKYKLRSHYSTGDHSHMLPFLWGPFLLLHLGGQDTITAFSMEDNNLWLRHLLNLVVQVTLTLYVFWKSFDIMDFQLLAVALPIFVAGLIKYGERTWALYSGSRDYLGIRKEGEEKPLQVFGNTTGDIMACYALNTVVRARGLLVGRTLFHLKGNYFEKEVVDGFEEYGKRVGQRDGKLKIVLMELRMMHDLLYTKAMVLHSMLGRILRCIAEISMVIALVLFVANSEQHSHNRADVAITYTLLTGAIFMEAYSVSMVVVSPWTRARLRKGTFLYWLSCSASSFLDAVMPRKMSSFSMGQFNLADCYMSEECMPKLISKVVSALGLEKKWRNIWHIQHVEDTDICGYIVNFLVSGEGSQQLDIAEGLKDALRMDFEQAILRLHIFTDLHLSNEFYDNVNNGRGHPEPNEMAVLAAECRKLSNYFMHLLTVHPSMLPVSAAAQDLEDYIAKWARDNRSGTMSKAEYLKKYAETKVAAWSPCFSSPPSVESLRAIKEVWVRLLFYAAGKCPGEEHARQLSNGLELLTYVWLLMAHHQVGDVGRRQVHLLEHIGDDDRVMQRIFIWADQFSVDGVCIGPLHAFKFRHQDQLQPTQEPPGFWPMQEPIRNLILVPWSPVRRAPQQQGTSLENDAVLQIEDEDEMANTEAPPANSQFDEDAESSEESSDPQADMATERFGTLAWIGGALPLMNRGVVLWSWRHLLSSLSPSRLWAALCRTPSIVPMTQDMEMHSRV